jgi:hypothetical protein
MEEIGEQRTVVFALIVTEPTSELVCVEGIPSCKKQKKYKIYKIFYLSLESATLPIHRLANIGKAST